MLARLRTLQAKRRADGGFTIIELSIVLTVLLIILAIIVPSYRYIVHRAKEDVLKDDLRTMRKMIDQYTADKEHAPHSLDDLVGAHYLREIPVDPMTSDAEWDVDLEDDSVAINGERGIKDVHSRSDDLDSSGAKRYSDW